MTQPPDTPSQPPNTPDAGDPAASSDPAASVDPAAPSDPAAPVGRSADGADPGRPKRQARARLPRRRAMRAVAVLAAAAILVVAVGELMRPGSAPPAPASAAVEPVGSVSLVCPEPGTGPDLGVRVAAAVVPDQPGQGSDGTAVLRTLPGDEQASARIQAPGGQAQVEAYGLAPGFTADQWGRTVKGDGRGMASVACTAARAQSWFVGGGATVGRRTRVLLVNPEDVAAQVDLEVFGPAGPVDVPAGRGVVVPPRSRAVLRVDALVPGTTVTAFHVVARSGRVAAAVNDLQVKALQPLGVDWIPASTGPATRVRVPGVSDGPGERLLSVLAPGKEDASVGVRVITADGSFAPVGVETIDAPAGQVVTVDLADALDGVAATVELTSDRPVVAGLRQSLGKKDQTPDTVYSTGADVIEGPAAVTTIPASRGEKVRLWVSAPDADARVGLELLPFTDGRAGKAVALDPVKVPGGRLGWVDVKAPEDVDWYTLVATPAQGSGPVLLAHRVVEQTGDGPLATGYPWTPLRVTVNVPYTVEDLAVALP